MDRLSVQLDICHDELPESSCQALWRRYLNTDPTMLSDHSVVELTSDHLVYQDSRSTPEYGQFAWNHTLDYRMLAGESWCSTSAFESQVNLPRRIGHFKRKSKLQSDHDIMQ